ncbi:MAG: hypothetical protein ACYDB4_04330 [Candidatus Dormibacteraceae bacterium]
MVRGVFDRLGMVGAILLASALIFAAIAGGVVVHRLESSPAASSTQEQGNQGDEQGDGTLHKTRPAKHSHPSGPEPGET